MTIDCRTVRRSPPLKLPVKLLPSELRLSNTLTQEPLNLLNATLATRVPMVLRTLRLAPLNLTTPLRRLWNLLLTIDYNLVQPLPTYRSRLDDTRRKSLTRAKDMPFRFVPVSLPLILLVMLC